MDEWSKHLPTRPSQHVKNDLARNKFRLLFTDPYFLIREETDNDYGVDICIEALVNKGKSPSNIRAHVQLKSSSKNQKIDGSYSYPVSISNLYYLLNNPGSLYVFYSVENDVFYFKSADEVFDFYDAQGDVWKKQKSISINFEIILGKEKVIEIHNSLIEASRLLKDIRLQINSLGIQPGAKLVYGELYFESSTESFQEYQDANNIGYVYSTDDKGKVIFLHNLIWENVHGPIPKGYQVYHVNGDLLDNRRDNLDIMKTVEAFPLEEFQQEVEEAQAYNIIALITQGATAELKDAPPPSLVLFNKVIRDLKKQGWIVSKDEMIQIKKILETHLEMNFE